MASPLKQKQGSRWGSLLSGAVAGIESRLDGILAEEPDASARSRATDKALTEAGAGSLKIPNDSTGVSRTNSRNRVNERLQERLAKAASQRAGSQVSSEVPSRAATPVIETSSPRTSLGSPRTSVDIPHVSSDKRVEEPVETEKAVQEDATLVELRTEEEPSRTLLTSELPINPARHSYESETRPSIEVEETTVTGSAEPEASATDPRTPDELLAEIEQMRNDYAESEHQRQEEMHANLERIDALQAKLQYLAKETVAAAKDANASAAGGTLEQKISEKDERIALLMEEGEKLSKAEMRHLTTIKKLRSKVAEDDKTAAELRRKLAKVEQAENETKQKLRRLEQSDKQNLERLQRLPRLESELQSQKMELEKSRSTIGPLRSTLNDLEKQLEDADRAAQQSTAKADSKRVAELQDEVADARLEKKLAEDRANAEIKKVKKESLRQEEQARTLEMELRSEIAGLDSNVESLRNRAEEVSVERSDGAQAKLLRQIETLQTQYSLAAENWRTIEGSLNSRLTTLERERDETAKRESDARKKARDGATKSKRLEAEIDELREGSRTLSKEREGGREEHLKTLARLELSDKALQEARVDFERQKRVWEAETNQRIDEERARHSRQGLGISGQHSQPRSSQPQSPNGPYRKTPALDSQPPSLGRRKVSRVFSGESGGLVADRQHSRRSSALPSYGFPPNAVSRSSVTPELVHSPVGSRQESMVSLSSINGLINGIPPTPSIQTNDIDPEDAFDRSSSPHQTVNDVISASTVHTGPSVQLVERMSSSIRKLETEKAAHKDEVARLLAQRDEARNEVVALMQEAEGKRKVDEEAAKLRKEVGDISTRYEACLEMLGEREEEVQELKGDVADLKNLYRELAETMGK